MIACATDTDDRETTYDHGHGKSDQHLNHAVTIGFSERLCFHNLFGQTFRSY